MTTTFFTILNKLTLLSVLTVAITGLSLNTAVNTQAASQNLQYNYLEVTSSNGANLRNANCEKIGAVNSKTILIQNVYLLDGDKQNLSCKVGNKRYLMIPVNVVSITDAKGPYTGTYVAKEFTNIIGNIPSNLSSKQLVSSPNGLNTRDKNCKKISSLKNGTEVEVEYSNLKPIFCKVNGQIYHLTLLIGNRYAASLFLK